MSWWRMSQLQRPADRQSITNVVVKHVYSWWSSRFNITVTDVVSFESRWSGIYLLIIDAISYSPCASALPRLGSLSPACSPPPLPSCSLPPACTSPSSPSLPIYGSLIISITVTIYKFDDGSDGESDANAAAARYARHLRTPRPCHANADATSDALRRYPWWFILAKLVSVTDSHRRCLWTISKLNAKLIDFSSYRRLPYLSHLRLAHNLVIKDLKSNLSPKSIL